MVDKIRGRHGLFCVGTGAWLRQTGGNTPLAMFLIPKTASHTITVVGFGHESLSRSRQPLFGLFADGVFPPARLASLGFLLGIFFIASIASIFPLGTLVSARHIGVGAAFKLDSRGGKILRRSSRNRRRLPARHLRNV